MSNLKRIGSIYDDILSKVEYDDVNERYYIDVFDYALFSFDKKNYAKFMMVCNENDIFLEVMPKILNDSKSHELFRNVKKIKEKLNNCSDLLMVKNYEKELCDLRTKLFEGHQLMIWRIIGINFPNIKESMYRDDIIQMGYVYLIRAIDNFDVDKAPSFDWYLSNYVLNNVFRDIKYIDKNIISNRDLIRLLEVRNKLYKDKGKLITLDDLVLETDFGVDKIRKMFTFEELIYFDDVCGMEDLVFEREVIDYDDLYFDGMLDKYICDNVFRESLIKIINTLSNELQRDVIIKYYGLDGNGALNTIEISKLFGITRQLAHYSLSEGLDNLRHPLRLKYIKELIEGYTESEFISEDIGEKEIEKNKYEQLELFLLNQLPSEELLEMISLIDCSCQESVLSYLGLVNGDLSYFDKIKKLGISVNTYLKRRDEGLVKLRKIINERYVCNSKNEDIKDLLDYLMYRYLNGFKGKVRIR